MADGVYQIDYLPVGTGSKAGDAICIRYASDCTFRDQKVIVIDGGYSDTGERIINHLRNCYATDTIDLVIVTHSDQDHCLGLKTVVSECNVKKLWMHKPWDHSEEIREYLYDGRITDNSLSERLRDSFKVVHDIEKLAIEKEIHIEEPFEGLEFDFGVIRILGPSKEYYQELLIQSPKTPEAKYVETGGLADKLQRFKERILEKLDDWSTETLKDPTDDATSHINSTSTIIWFNWASRNVLFTADSGVQSLQRAIGYAKTKSYNILSPSILHCPHHGSRRNVGPSLLNQFNLLSTSVMISCPPDGRPKHPSQRVINAFNRRGAKVMQTAGDGVMHHYNAPRIGWEGTVPLLEFVPDVTEEIESQEGE